MIRSLKNSRLEFNRFDLSQFRLKYPATFYIHTEFEF